MNNESELSLVVLVGIAAVASCCFAFAINETRDVLDNATTAQVDRALHD